jgi:hypothetical protein
VIFSVLVLYQAYLILFSTDKTVISSYSVATGLLTPRTAKALPYHRHFSPFYMFGPLPAHTLTEHTGGAIGSSTSLCSYSAVSSSCLVAACEPLAWRDSRQGCLSEPEQRHSQLIPLEHAPSPHKDLRNMRAWILRMGQFILFQLTQLHATLSGCLLLVLRFVLFLHLVPACLLSSRDVFVSHRYTVIQPWRYW